MAKIDFKKELGEFYKVSPKAPVVVDVPRLNFLMIDGKGDPNTSKEYADAVETLYAVSYTVKFAIKKGSVAVDYGVMPLEGLWWADDMRAFDVGDKSAWKWTMMIMQPPVVTGKLAAECIDTVRAKKNPPAIERIRFDAFEEGLAAHILHVGPFSEEGPTIAKLHDFIGGQGTLRGKHHEIYLTDIRRANPSRWKTIIRQPMTAGR
mgnify:CR=1 FL=1